MSGVCVCDLDELSAFGEDTSSDDYDYEHEYTGSYLASEATRELGAVLLSEMGVLWDRADEFQFQGFD